MKQIPLRTPARLVARLVLDDVEVEAGFSELVRCDFPLSGWGPIPVEIPQGGSRSWYGACARGEPQEDARRSGPGAVHVPRYRDARVLKGRRSLGIERKAYPGEVERLVAATPIFALATRSHHIEADHSRFVAASVLLVWSSRIAVVVSLDGTEGVASEGAPSPEWHVRASQGLPIERALEELASRSQVFPLDARTPHSLHVMPVEVGAAILGRDGNPMGPSGVNGPAWGGEWRFDRFEDLNAALKRFQPGLQDFAAHVMPSA